MKNIVISAKDAPAAVGPYSHAMQAGSTLYTSGQLGINPATGTIPEGVEAQAEQAMKNLGAVLNTAGMDFGDVVKTTVFLKNMSDFAAINAIYGKYFTANSPARSCVAVAALPKDGLYEIEAIAVK